MGFLQCCSLHTWMLHSLGDLLTMQQELQQTDKVKTMQACNIQIGYNKQIYIQVPRII